MLTKLGRYQLQEELGRGAMGVVFRGYDPTIGRTVALKMVILEKADEETLLRLRREAQAAGILSHPNIVTIYDAGEDQGVFYIAMEYVQGETLQSMVAKGPLPLERVVSILEQVGAALDHAHQRQIIHRDIKPANIMIAGDVAKVMDFGVAKISNTTLTQAGTALGTPSYMAPEVVKGLPVDSRADIFSLGVVLYEMLTGRKPFVGENVTTVIYKIIGEQPELPTASNPDLPGALNAVILKALAKEPATRYQNCAEMVADLEKFSEEAAKAPAAAGETEEEPPGMAAFLMPETSAAAAPPPPPRPAPPSAQKTATPPRPVSPPAPPSGAAPPRPPSAPVTAPAPPSPPAAAAPPRPPAAPPTGSPPQRPAAQPAPVRPPSTPSQAAAPPPRPAAPPAPPPEPSVAATPPRPAAAPAPSPAGVTPQRPAAPAPAGATPQRPPSPAAATPQRPQTPATPQRPTSPGQSAPTLQRPQEPSARGMSAAPWAPTAAPPPPAPASTPAPQVAPPRQSRGAPAWLLSAGIIGAGTLVLVIGILLVRRAMVEKASQPPPPPVVTEAPGPAKKPAHKRAAGEGKAAKTATEIVEFQVLANVEGATVKVDGQTKPEWVTPCHITVRVGLHRVEVSKPGYQARTRSVEFSGDGPFQLKFELAQASSP